MAVDLHLCGIIEQRPPQPPVVEDKTEGLDQVDLDPETGGEAQQRPGILRNVGFEQSQAQIGCSGQVAEMPVALYRTRIDPASLPFYAAVCHIVRLLPRYSLPIGRLLRGTAADYEGLDGRSGAIAGHGGS